MPTRRYTIHEAKTHFSKLLQMACSGEEVVILRGSIPMVRLIPLSEKLGPRKPGSMKNKLKIGPELFQPLPDDELSAWEA